MSSRVTLKAGSCILVDDRLLDDPRLRSGAEGRGDHDGLRRQRGRGLRLGTGLQNWGRPWLGGTRGGGRLDLEGHSLRGGGRGGEGRQRDLTERPLPGGVPAPSSTTAAAAPAAAAAAATTTATATATAGEGAAERL